MMQFKDSAYLWKIYSQVVHYWYIFCGQQATGPENPAAAPAKRGLCMRTLSLTICRAISRPGRSANDKLQTWKLIFFMEEKLEEQRAGYLNTNTDVCSSPGGVDTCIACIQRSINGQGNNATFIYLKSHISCIKSLLKIYLLNFG